MVSLKRLSSVSIRRGLPADLPDLDAVIEGCEAPPPAVALAAVLSARDRFIYLAETERAFGFVAAGTKAMGDERDGEGEILGLFVLPRFQGHGIGHKLLVQGISVLKRRHFETVIAWVWADSPAATRVLASVGFERVAQMQRMRNEGTATLVEDAWRIDLDGFF